jgi:acetyltransferase-like isoleucine patch superfamily enzyme
VNIGRNTSINGPNTNLISYLNAIRIGNYCSIAEGVLFQEYNHNFKRPSTYFFEKNIFRTKQITDVSSKGEIIVGNDVWIGAHSLILSGANIGNGAIIGANSVVIGEIPSYAIAVGSPAKVIKYRFKPEIISQLEKIEWWNWSEEKVLLNKEFFLRDINESTIEAIK